MISGMDGSKATWNLEDIYLVTQFPLWISTGKGPGASHPTTLRPMKTHGKGSGLCHSQSLREVLQGNISPGKETLYRMPMSAQVGTCEHWLFFAETCGVCQGSAMATKFIPMKNGISKLHPLPLLSPRHLLRRVLNVPSQPHLFLPRWALC